MYIEQFSDFCNNQKLQDFDKLTDEEQFEEMRTWYRLKLLSEKEQYTNQLSQALAIQAKQVEKKAELVIKLQTEGYKCDGSLDDFMRFFKKPELYGENWEEVAKVKYEAEGDKLENFLKLF